VTVTAAVCEECPAIVQVSERSTDYLWGYIDAMGWILSNVSTTLSAEVHLQNTIDRLIAEIAERSRNMAAPLQQEPLGAEFSKVLHDNLESLYIEG
jgi:hypothetical protein